MKRLIREILIGAGSVCLLAQAMPGGAETSGTSTAVILKNSAAVRAEGMGGAQAAVVTDEAGASGWNPAGLYGNRLPGLSAVYSRGVSDDNYGAIHFDMPLGAGLAAGAGLSYYDAGAFELNTESGESSSVSAQRDFLLAVTGAYRVAVLRSDLVFGASLKFLHSTLLGSYTAMAAAVDLGTRWDLPGALKDWRLGLAVKNVGTPLKYIDSADPLPLYGLAGLSYSAFKNTLLGVLLAADVQYAQDGALHENLGAEIRVAEILAIRGGYKLGYDLDSFTLGAGLNYENFVLDYTFSARSALNSVHVASLKYVFGPSLPEAEEPAAAEPEYQLPKVEPQDEGPVEKIPVGVAEIRRAGGRVTEVVLYIGSNQGIKPGFKGTLLDASARPLGAFIIRQVDPKLSLAEVVGLGRDISGDTTAVVDKPLAK